MTTYTQKLLFLYLVYVFANIVWPIELGLTYQFMGFGSSLFVWACTWRAQPSGLRRLSVAPEIEGSNPFARPIKYTISLQMRLQLNGQSTGLRTQGLQVRILPGAPLIVVRKVSSNVPEAFVFQNRFTTLRAYLGDMLIVDYLAICSCGLNSYPLSSFVYLRHFARNTGITLSVRA